MKKHIEVDGHFLVGGELTGEKAVGMWFTWLDRVADAVREANLTPEEMVELFLAYGRELFNRRPIPNSDKLFRDEAHWRDYLAFVREAVPHLRIFGNEETQARNAVLIDLIIDNLSYLALLAFRSDGNGDLDNRVVKIKYGKEGKMLVVREDDMAAGIIKPNGLHLVGRIGPIEVIAEEGIGLAATELWLERSTPVIEEMMDQGFCPGADWKRGFEKLGMLYLSAGETSFAFWPLPGRERDLMVIGAGRLARMSISELAEVRGISYLPWGGGVLPHELHHLWAMRYFSVNRGRVEGDRIWSTAIMELMADKAKADYLTAKGNWEMVSKVSEVCIWPMADCIQGKELLSKFPENGINRQMMVSNLTMGQWRELFEIFRIWQSDNYRHVSPPPPPSKLD